MAAVNVHGQTIHKQYSLPLDNKYSLDKLSGEKLKVIRSEFNGIQYHIWDEMSMIGLATFS